MEVTSIDPSCMEMRFAWRPLLRRLKQDFWTLDDAPLILVGLNPDLCEGDRAQPQGWHFVWITGFPIGRYATFDSFSLEMNLAHDLRAIRAALNVRGPDGFAPNEWIDWSKRFALAPPWLSTLEILRQIAVEKGARRLRKSERHSFAAKQRRDLRKYDIIRSLIWEELAAGVKLDARGRKTEFDRRMADKHGIDPRLAQSYRISWHKSQDAE